MKNRLPDSEFVEIVKSSYSKAEVIRKMGLIPAGGNYATVKTRIQELTLSTSHFTGKGHLKGKTHSWSKRRALNEILRIDSRCTGRALKARLFKAGLLTNQCGICGQLPVWNGKPLVLEIDHINGVRNDNRIENLRIVCAHCHSQTATFRGRNINSKFSAQDGTRTHTPLRTESFKDSSATSYDT